MARALYLRYQPLIHEGAKFGVVGAIGFVVTDGGTNLLKAYTSLGWLESTIIATVVAIGVTYLGSRYWTFRHRVRTGMSRETAVFFGLALIGLLIQLACVGFTTHVLRQTGKLPANIALLAGIMLGTLFRFWSYRKWVWAAPAGLAVVPSALDEVGQSLTDEVGRPPLTDEVGRPR